MTIIVTAKPPKRRKGLTPIKRLHEQKAPTPEEEAEADRRATEFIERMLADARDARAFVLGQQPQDEPDREGGPALRSRASRGWNGR